MSLFRLHRRFPRRRRLFPGPVPRRLADVVLVAAAVVLTLVVPACTRGTDRSSDGAAFDFDFEIPAGTYERVTRGEDVDIFPAELRAKVGQRIRIVNRDLVGQTIGPYYVGPESTVQQTFRSAGTIEGLCTAHPSRSIRIVVEDPDGAASTSTTTPAPKTAGAS